MKLSSAIPRLMGGLLCAMALALPAAAAEVEGVKLDDSAKVAGKDLKLNGAGVRTRAIFKVYVMGLYLPDKKKTTADVLAVDGPRRFTLVMLRDISGEDFGEAFMSGINKNTDKAEKSKIINQMARFGEIFTTQGSLKKGDILVTDWVPGTGTVMTLNGKSVSEPLPDLAFYNALLKIWLGDKPADTSLKPLLLGEKAS
ncbi:chalcone isomerase family protein [Ideonella sp.]|uniref:chalcone isomerase family protein n=1 Tax=Ideonella sp. TaxID=1929293 RepID=UPI0035B04E5B